MQNKTDGHFSLSFAKDQNIFKALIPKPEDPETLIPAGSFALPS